MKEKKLFLTGKQRKLLEEIRNSRSSKKGHQIRAEIILRSSTGDSITQISRKLTICRYMARTWIMRWKGNMEQLKALDDNETGISYKRSVLKILSDKKRKGAPPKFTAEQICQIINVSCEKPEESGLPLSHWSLTSLAAELVNRKIVDSISTSQLHVFLKSGRNKATQSKGMDTHADRG